MCSAVRSGKQDARNRAKQRHRGDRRPPPDDFDPDNALREWLAATERFRDLDDDDARRLDLQVYLVTTGHFDVPADERLRQLAISIEYYFPWDAVDRIYEAALRIDPDYSALWHSRGLSTKRFAEVEPQPSARFDKLMHHARRSYLRAYALDPKDSLLLHCIGMWHYDFGAPGDAREWFERAIAVRPEYADALRFRAHCLHDQNRWRDAAEAYDAVPLDSFTGFRAPLVDTIQLSRAHCLMRAGDLASASVLFARLLKRFTLDPESTEDLPLRYLSEACLGPLRDALWFEYMRIAPTLNLPL